MTARTDLAWWSTYFDADYLVEHAQMLDPARTRREVGRVLALAGLPVGASVLDVPCGQGRHAHLLAEAGLNVVGLDYSAHLLRIARRGGSSPSLRFTRGDMRSLPSGWTARFDAVVSLGASFGFFASPADDATVLSEYARVLRPGGVLILHAPNRDGVASAFVAKDWWEAADGTLVLHERQFDPLSGVLDVRRSLRRGSRRSDRAYRLRLYSPTQVADLARASGMLVTEAFDDYHDRPLRRKSGMMLLRAVRDAA